MADARSPWRALRPVFLAGAAAIGWLTLSSTAASADPLSDTSSLLGGVTSSVSATVSSVTGAAGPAPVGAAAPSVAQPAQAKPAGLLQPVTGQVSAVADNLVASVPVVGQVVPNGAVGSVTAPVAHAVDGTAATVVEAVVPPVAETVPVLEPVLVPVSDLVTGAAPLPLPDLAGPLPSDGLPAIAPAPSATSAQDAPAPGNPAVVADDAAVTDEQPGDADITGSAAVETVSAPLAAGPAYLSDTGSLDAVVPARSTGDEHPVEADPAPQPAQAPAVPGTGAGSGGSSSVASGGAAWLATFDLNHVLSRAVLVREDDQHTPAPVSFDPGSSPD